MSSPPINVPPATSRSSTPVDDDSKARDMESSQNVKRLIKKMEDVYAAFTAQETQASARQMSSSDDPRSRAFSFRFMIAQLLQDGTDNTMPDGSPIPDEWLKLAIEKFHEAGRKRIWAKNEDCQNQRNAAEKMIANALYFRFPDLEEQVFVFNNRSGIFAAPDIRAFGYRTTIGWMLGRDIHNQMLDDSTVSIEEFNEAVEIFNIAVDRGVWEPLNAPLKVLDICREQRDIAIERVEEARKIILAAGFSRPEGNHPPVDEQELSPPEENLFLDEQELIPPAGNSFEVNHRRDELGP